MLISFILTALLPLFASAEDAASLSMHDKQTMLEDLSKRKDSLAQKLKEARLKEAYASDKLRNINSKLREAQTEMSLNRRYLENNKLAWHKTKTRLEEIQAQRSELEGEARNRIQSIYKQDRMKLVDGILNSNSSTDYMDHLYYQKRIMQYDKDVLDALVDQTENIRKYNAVLAQEAQKIQEVNERLRVIESEVGKQKAAQAQVLTRLQGERKVYEDSERQLEQESVKLIYKISELAVGRLDNPGATGHFLYPVKARITSPFGPRRHPIFGVRSMHSGIDLGAPRGTPIKASEGGLVIYAGWYGGYGKVVIVDHSKGFTTLYAHMDTINVSVGQRVNQSAVLGYEGATGYATGPHLHFEVRSQGKPQNPVYYLQDS